MTINALKVDFGGARRNRPSWVSHSTAATGATRGSETGNVVRSVVMNTRLNVKKFAYLTLAHQLNADRFFQSPQQFLAIVGDQLIMTLALLKVKEKDYVVKLEALKL